LIATEEQNRKERINMKSKTENNKVPKSAKTRLSDLTPKKDARGGAIPTPPVYYRSSDRKPRAVSSIRRSTA